MNNEIESIRSVLKSSRSELMKKKNVVATGIGYKIRKGEVSARPAIICSVEKKVPKSALKAEDLISPEISGVLTDVVPTGPVSILQQRTSRVRPAPGGVSIGHYLISAGTLGCLVKKNGQIYILSNNHVIANSNEAAQGDPILQPGPHDGGSRPADEIATLSEFVPIVFEDGGNGGLPPCPTAGFITGVLNALAAASGSKTRLRQYRIQQQANKVDCAIALPNSNEDVTGEILEIGRIQGIAEGTLGMSVKKSGRTTGLTTDTIQQVDVTVRVNFGAGRTALFEDQLMAGAMSQGGDSGSAVLDEQNRLTGLLFAGGPTTTIFNRIQNVFSALDLELA